jgi:uncharacterized protein involved in exopolysaccharide biosynthesis
VGARAGDLVYTAFRDQEYLGNIIRRERLYDHLTASQSLNRRIHDMRLAMQIGSTGNSADGSFRFSFSDSDPDRAQRILKELLGQMTKTSLEGKGSGLETITPPSRPIKRVGLNRALMITTGIGLGALAGSGLLLVALATKTRTDNRKGA